METYKVRIDMKLTESEWTLIGLIVAQIAIAFAGLSLILFW